ncbi:hypothetical protein PSTT_15510 [Puccinia striiformis]|uniref:Uncharacterized protein n=1 Tax=Puccinia striiformis TaxID=27350 RepID=A0A2S4UHD7_9BASI|nr:hypothetical protein PSTT_15510 [Puccinia striiformis]
MPNYCEEPASLSEFHWLFSEELAEESLPCSSQEFSASRPASPFRPAPRVRRDQSYDYEEAPSPNFDPENDASYFSIESGSAARNSSDPNSGPCPIPPPEALLSLRSATRKRHAEGTHEDDHRPQKYYRRSECQSSNIGYSSNSDASQSESQSRTPPSTASPALQCCGCQSDPSSLNFDQSLEIQHLRAQLAVSESRGANAIAELEASRTCVDFLLNEVRRVIDSGLDLDPRNPHSYYFSQDSLAPAAGSQPTNPHSSQFAPLAGFHTFESIPSVGLEPSSSHSEMSRVPSECYVPTQSTSVLPQHRRSRDPSGSQLMQEWNHARLDSYINLYFAEPLPSVNTFQEPPQNLAQPYQMSTNVLI